MNLPSVVVLAGHKSSFEKEKKGMSLVDYASSSDDENDAVPEKDETSQPRPGNPNNIGEDPDPPPNPTPTSVEKLPDAALILGGGPSSSSLLGKRDPVRVGPALPRSKVPRGAHLPHPKNVPDTGGGLLVPPQLSGRRNVVTEDIGKLFVRRNTVTPKLESVDVSVVPTK